jgi:integrase
MPTKEARAAMLDKYVDSLSDDQKRKGGARTDVYRFLEFVGYRELTHDNIKAYVEHLRESDYAAGTIKLVWGRIHRFFIVNKIDWPCRTQDTPVVRQSDKYTPAIHPKIILLYIDTAKQGKLSARATAFLALSTTYGLRQNELIKVLATDIDIKSKTILARTSKHGRERLHKLPDEIIPYITKYDYPTISKYWADRAYKEIELAAGREHLRETGFHAFRRTIVTEVGNYCTPSVVHSFFRWANMTMEQQYTSVQYVGLDTGDENYVVGDDLSGDNLVLAKHPFVKAWGGKA